MGNHRRYLSKSRTSKTMNQNQTILLSIILGLSVTIIIKIQDLENYIDRVERSLCKTIEENRESANENTLCITAKDLEKLSTKEILR